MRERKDTAWPRWCHVGAKRPRPWRSEAVATMYKPRKGPYRRRSGPHAADASANIDAPTHTASLWEGHE
jgi:hypothetical protein